MAHVRGHYVLSERDRRSSNFPAIIRVEPNINFVEVESALALIERRISREMIVLAYCDVFANEKEVFKDRS